MGSELRLNSYLFILPINLSRTDQDEIRAIITVPTSPAHGLHLVNLAIALRMAYYVWMTSDQQFKWLAQSQLTMDATLFFIGLLMSMIPYGIHSALLRHKHNFTFQGNSVLKLSRRLAGMHPYYIFQLDYRRMVFTKT